MFKCCFIQEGLYVANDRVQDGAAVGSQRAGEAAVLPEGAIQDGESQGGRCRHGRTLLAVVFRSGRSRLFILGVRRTVSISIFEPVWSWNIKSSWFSHFCMKRNCGFGMRKTLSAPEADCGGREQHRRYFQCPAALPLGHLVKFLRAKYNVPDPAKHKVSVPAVRLMPSSSSSSLFCF